MTLSGSIAVRNYRKTLLADGREHTFEQLDGVRSRQHDGPY